MPRVTIVDCPELDGLLDDEIERELDAAGATREHRRRTVYHEHAPPGQRVIRASQDAEGHLVIDVWTDERTPLRQALLIAEEKLEQLIARHQGRAQRVAAGRTRGRATRAARRQRDERILRAVDDYRRNDDLHGYRTLVAHVMERVKVSDSTARRALKRLEIPTR